MNKKIQNIPGLTKTDLEFFTTDFTDAYMFFGAKAIDFESFPRDVYFLLYNEMNNDQRIYNRLDECGIIDMNEKVKRFTICRFGAYNDKADYNVKEKKFEDTEFLRCGNHGNCPYNLEGIMCQQIKLTNGQILTQSELNYIKYVCLDLADKEIADKTNRSLHTIQKHRQNITKKLGVNSKVGIAVFGCDNDIRFTDLIKNQILTNKKGG